MLYISSQSQMIHTTATCSVTRRNLASNLETRTPARELAKSYRGCKRCDADRVLAEASTTSSPEPRPIKATHTTVYNLVVDLMSDGMNLADAKREAARQCGVTAKVVRNAIAAHARRAAR
jgi:methylphosphotriester-DNA--protein-cysteine methyltransferase